MRTVKPPQPRYHSSQQVSYADFRRVLDEFHFVQSFSAKGHPLNINSTIVPSETLKKIQKTARTFRFRRFILELMVGIEPTTCSLRVSCSTPEPH